MVPLSEPQEAPASRGFALADVLLPAGMPLELQCTKRPYKRPFKSAKLKTIRSIDRQTG